MPAQIDCLQLQNLTPQTLNPHTNFWKPGSFAKANSSLNTKKSSELLRFECFAMVMILLHSLFIGSLAGGGNLSNK